MNDNLFDKNNRKKLLDNLKDLDIPTPTNYSIEQLSHITLSSYYEKKHKKQHLQSTPAGKYLMDNCFIVESMKSLYDAAQYITFGKDALLDVDYSLKPNKYVSCLEDDLFSINAHGVWQNFLDVEKAKDGLSQLIKKSVKHNDADAEKIAFTTLDLISEIIYAMASKDNYDGMNEFASYANKLMPGFTPTIDIDFLKEMAFMADYNYYRSGNIKMPLGKAGRFIEEFSKKHPDPINYRLN